MLDWLCTADPAIHWQVMRDILDAPEADWQRVRRTVETTGWGARLLACQGDDGLWAGGTFVPRDFDWSTMRTVGQPWTATCWALSQLREFGLDPASPRARHLVEQITAHARWDHANEPFWEGETDECINGRTVADGAYFGVDVSSIVARLLREQQADGGWNCERYNGSLRASFDSTINVLEGLLAYERATGGTAATVAARESGEAYLLTRGLFRRRSTGAIAQERYLTLSYPHRWRHDILRALDYFRSTAQHTGARPDPRLHEAIDLLRAKQQADGRWLLESQLPGATWFHLDDGPGAPSAWITLKALRVLRWADAT
jgi:hypothetical protein